jgi:hypothetical protein
VQPPVTWNEIFTLATFKRIPVGLATSNAENNLILTSPEIFLHKAPYLQSWQIGLVEHTASFLKTFTQGFFSQTIGGDELVAHRFLGFLLACCVFVTGRRAPFIIQSQHSSLAWAAFLMLLVRWGSNEQLFILLFLSLACFLFTSSTQHERVQTSNHRLLQCFLVFLMSLALVASNSRTWIYSLIPAVFVYSITHPNRKMLWTKSVTLLSLSILFFLALFLSASSYESLISHLTQRWIYLNEPRYLSIDWAGSKLFLRIVALWIAILSMRRWIIRFFGSQVSSSPSAMFLKCLCWVAGLHISLYQKSPLAADLLLLSFLFFIDVKFASSTEEVSSFTRNQRMMNAFLNHLVHLFTIALALGGVLLAGSIFIHPLIHSFAPISTLQLMPVWAASTQGIRQICLQHPFLSLLSGGGVVLLARAALKHWLLNPSLDPSLLWPTFKRDSLVAVATLMSLTELRSHFIWGHLNQTLQSVPSPQTLLLYLPNMEPLLLLHPLNDFKGRRVTFFAGESYLHVDKPSLLLVQADSFDACESAGWPMEARYGLFGLCNSGQGSIPHLYPMDE